MFVDVNRNEWRLEVIDQKIDECPGASGLVALPGVVDKEVGRRYDGIWQHELQTSTLHILGKIPFRSYQDPVSIESPAQDNVAIVAGERAFHFQRLRVVVHDVPPHAIRIIVLPMNDASVLQQIFNALGCSEAFEIFRGCAKKATIAHDAPRTEAAVGQLPEPYCHIERTFHQVDRSVCDFKLNLDMREPLGELRHKWGYRRSAEAKGRVHPQ